MSDYLKITCPFSPCRWFGEPIRQQARFGDPETNWVMPIHEVVGEGSWFGRCPGSMLIVPEVTRDGLAVLGNAHREYLKRRIERERAEQQREAERAAAEFQAKYPGRLPDESFIDYIARRPSGPIKLPNTDGIADLIRKGAARVDPRLGGDLDSYFPGRPADAPEPGPGDPPAPLPEAAKDATIVPLGGTVDSARDNLNALIASCGAALDSSIEDLVRVQGMIDRALAAAATAGQTLGQARSLINVTVGAGGSNTPEPATRMTGMAALSRVTLIGGADQAVIPYLTAARDGIAAAINQAAAARAAQREYLAMPK